MGIVLDLIVLASIGLSIFLGYKQGLVGVAYKILSFVVAIVLAFVLSGPVSNFIIENTELDETIHNTIQGTLESKKGEETNTIENTIDNTTAEENKAENNVSAVITDYLAEQVKKTAADTQDQVAVSVADGLTNNIVYALTFIGIFIVARILLIVIKFFAEALADLPLIKQFNYAGGIAYGILRGLFIVFLFFAIISLLASIANINGFLEIINSSIISKFAYNNNLLLKILF